MRPPRGIGDVSGLFVTFRGRPGSGHIWGSTSSSIAILLMIIIIISIIISIIIVMIVKILIINISTIRFIHICNMKEINN